MDEQTNTRKRRPDSQVLAALDALSEARAAIDALLYGESPHRSGQAVPDARDYFAASVLDTAAFRTRIESTKTGDDLTNVARLAWRLADAMLATRDE